MGVLWEDRSGRRAGLDQAMPWGLCWSLNFTPSVMGSH